MSIISTVPKGAAVEGINPNLLDNWYFPNPVNQRGQSSYSTDGAYTIDRWKLGGAVGTARFDSTGALMSNQTLISNWFETSRVISGATYTISALWSNGLITATGTLVIGSGTSVWQISYGEVTTPRTIAIRQVGANTFQFILVGDGTNKAIAAKVELGTEQTLAHQENGVWVLNEIPDYGEELRKCQRYYFSYQIPSGVAMAVVGLRGDLSAGTNIGAQIDIPVVMAKVPTIDAVAHSIRGNGTNWNTGLSVTSTPLGMYGNHIAIEVIASNASFPGLTSGYAILFSKLNLSAEL